MIRFACILLLTIFASPALAQPGTRIYAQELVDRAVAKHPEIVAVEMHVTPPKSAENIVIAAYNGHLGEKADAEDLGVIATGKTSVGVNKAGDRIEVNQVLLDASHRSVGSIGIAFSYKAGDDKAALQKKAENIRDDMARRISHVANLMEKTPFDASIPTHTFAQKLVDEALDANKDIVIIATHVATPTNKNYPIIASNIGRIGKVADDDDMSVIRTAKPKLEINESGDRFESEGVLRDSTGHVIGVVGVVFPYHQGDDKQALHKRADSLRDAWAKQIPNAAKLLTPYP